MTKNWNEVTSNLSTLSQKREELSDALQNLRLSIVTKEKDIERSKENEL